ncbi:hypothetical protein GUITHDRAFT_134492 [Guillardia theta CCMP2712]|uniref:Uncharacterized protein n=1 Tax=Guillardia theta (strain CCMP2712) TaxID=905079 RepID=L1JU20_GUITC|nr:hypothetical protein GUITHDRAFT_134492 [Guillardia theta CCMP2712]EKX51588.1 hypothetical protein GUITHDRAFT_134492 [Guillardia theta CCMP2712]|eukprot:XP_005838568.1 hypothetical protein GUITHDRAFT_134492 [Guillardia theta CCMP2712]
MQSFTAASLPTSGPLVFSMLPPDAMLGAPSLPISSSVTIPNLQTTSTSISIPISGPSTVSVPIPQAAGSISVPNQVGIALTPVSLQYPASLMMPGPAVVQPVPEQIEPLCPQEIPVDHIGFKFVLTKDSEFPKTVSNENGLEIKLDDFQINNNLRTGEFSAAIGSAIAMMCETTVEKLNLHYLAPAPEVLDPKKDSQSILNIVQKAYPSIPSEIVNDEYTPVNYYILCNILNTEKVISVEVIAKLNDKTHIAFKNIKDEKLFRQIQEIKGLETLIKIYPADCNHFLCLESKVKMQLASNASNVTAYLRSKLEDCQVKYAKCEAAYVDTRNKYLKEEQAWTSNTKEEGNAGDGKQEESSELMIPSLLAKYETAFKTEEANLRNVMSALIMSQGLHESLSVKADKARAVSGLNCPNFLVKIFSCGNGCGFTGALEDVDIHEGTCPLKFTCTVCGTRGSSQSVRTCEQTHAMQGMTLQWQPAQVQASGGGV